MYFGCFGGKNLFLAQLASTKNFAKYDFDFGVIYYNPALDCYGRGNCFIIGDLYHRDNFLPVSNSEKSVFDKLEFEAIHAKYWGNYLIFRYHSGNHTFEIFKGLAAKIDVFYASFDTRSVLFANTPECIFKINNCTLKFNQSYLLSYLLDAENMHRVVDTAFSGVSRLPQGCSLSLSQDFPIAKIKLEADITKIGYYNDDVVSINKALPETLKSVIKALLSHHQGNIGIQFSGGLDSSSILYLINAISQPNSNIYAFNLFHSDIASSNEYDYAKLVSQELENVKLLKVLYQKARAFTPVTQNILLSTPCTTITGLKLGNYIASLISKYKIDIMFSGEGGDHLFQAPPSPEFVCDLIIDKGFGSVFNTAKELAMQLRMPLWKLLKSCSKGLYQYYLGLGYFDNIGARPINVEQVEWLKDGVGVVEKLSYSPIYSIKNIMPGKFEQIDSVYRALTITCGGMYSYNAYPFLTEPVIELGLSIPTYELFGNGYDRYIFRKAMSDFLSVNTLWRKDKGEITGVLQLGLRHNLKYITELCMDGFFANKQFIDTEKLYLALNASANGAPLAPELQNLLAIELFVKQFL